MDDDYPNTYYDRLKLLCDNTLIRIWNVWDEEILIDQLHDRRDEMKLSEPGNHYEALLMVTSYLRDNQNHPENKYGVIDCICELWRLREYFYRFEHWKNIIGVDFNAERNEVVITDDYWFNNPFHQETEEERVWRKEGESKYRKMEDLFKVHGLHKVDLQQLVEMAGFDGDIAWVPQEIF